MLPSIFFLLEIQISALGLQLLLTNTTLQFLLKYAPTPTIPLSIEINFFFRVLDHDTSNTSFKYSLSFLTEA